MHAPNTEAVILSGNERELENYMLAGRELGMIDFQTALRQAQAQLDPQIPDLRKRTALADHSKISRKADFLRRAADAGLWRTSRTVSRLNCDQPRHRRFRW